MACDYSSVNIHIYRGGRAVGPGQVQELGQQSVEAKLPAYEVGMLCRRCSIAACDILLDEDDDCVGVQWKGAGKMIQEAKS